MRSFLMGIIVILFAGCVPYSDIPLTDPDKQPLDTDILGSWYWKTESDSGYIHIGLDETATKLRLMLVEFEQDGKMTSTEFCGHTSKLQDKTYLNLKRVRPEDREPGYLFIKYSFKSGALGISIMNAQTVSKDIESGLLKGTVTRDQWTSNIHVTASREALQQYVITHDGALYSEISHLSRVKLP
jgi:hypothetical protein